MLGRIAHGKLALVIMAGLLVSPAVWADDRPPESISAAAAAAMHQMRPLTAADLDQAKTALQAALDRLDERLQGDSSSGAAWRKWLDVDRLKALVAGSQPPQPADLQPIYENFSSGYYGLNLTSFAAVRNTLGTHIGIAKALQDPAWFEKTYKAFITALVRHVESFEKHPNAADAYFISSTIQWLQAYGQAPDLVSRLRDRFQQPNLYVDVAARLVNAAVGGAVDETLPLNDLILGTTICGTVHTYGTVSTRLTPDTERAIVDTYFSGSADSDSVGYNGPAIICTTGHTNLSAVKRLWVDASGLNALPADSDANTCTTINGVSSCNGRRIVERVASRRAAEQKPQAEAEAACHAKQRLNERMDSQGSETIARANGQMEERVRRPLTDRGVFPSVLKYLTTEDSVQIVGLESAGHQLGAGLSSPPSAVSNVDLSMRLHESMINNFTDVVFSGLLLTEEDARQIMTELTGSFPDEMKSEPGSPSWTMQFAREQPVTLSVGEGEIQIIVRAIMLRGPYLFEKDREYNEPLDIVAHYRTVSDGSTPGLVHRTGPVEVRPHLERARSGREAVELANVSRKLVRRFNRIFPETPNLDLEPKGNLAKIGKLTPAVVAAHSGWMSIGWNRASLAAAAQPISQPARPQ